MRAVTIVNEELVIAERATPQPGPHDVLVEVAAAGLNAADQLQRRGFYPAPPGWPEDVPGLECAGVVIERGSEVRDVAIGQRVAAIVGGGGQATHCVVPAEHLLLLPDHVSWPEAGGFAEAATTAYDALVLQAELREGEHVVVSGAAGGVGTAAVQIARSRGAHVTAVTRDDRHHEQLRAVGAQQCVTLDEVTSLESVDVVIELVGAAHLGLIQTRLAHGARVVVIGVGGGGRVDVDLLGLMSRRAHLTGSTLRARSREEKAAIAEAVNLEVVPLLASGALTVPVAATFPLEEAEAAYASFATPGKFGKIVLLR